MNKLFMSAVLTIAMTVANIATAGPSKDHYADETWAATRIAYNMLLNGMEIIDGYPGRDIVVTHQEPAVCWPFPIEWEVFYRAIQDSVNADVESYPKREQGRLGVTIGWKVWNALQDNWGC